MSNDNISSAVSILYKINEEFPCDKAAHSSFDLE